MKTKVYLIILLVFFFKSNIFGQSSLIINEFEAKNSSTIKDNNGDYDDWIEILNTSNQSINLNGYFITNDLKRNRGSFTMAHFFGNAFQLPVEE